MAGVELDELYGPSSPNHLGFCDFLSASSSLSLFTPKRVLAQLWEAAEVLLTGLVQSRCNNIHTRIVVCSDNQEQEKISCGFCQPSQAACGV